MKTDAARYGVAAATLRYGVELLLSDATQAPGEYQALATLHVAWDG